MMYIVWSVSRLCFGDIPQSLANLNVFSSCVHSYFVFFSTSLCAVAAADIEMCTSLSLIVCVYHVVLILCAFVYTSNEARVTRVTRIFFGLQVTNLFVLGLCLFFETLYKDTVSE
jgi:hypothetical protein